jgi:UDP-N-acetylmuramyl pentapeptide synthase
LKKFLSLYSHKFASSLVYMLQASEYDIGEFMAWFKRSNDLSVVARRAHLKLTPKASLLLAFAWVMIIIEAVVLVLLLTRAIFLPPWYAAAIIFLLIAPYVTLISLLLVLWMGSYILQRPRETKIIAEASRRIEHQRAKRIAIAGSYGKTSFKEMLQTILSESLSVAATPGNMNTPIGISRFVKTLTGKEDVLIFELGEYYPGDIANLSALVKPQMGIITGINEAHLSRFKTIARTKWRQRYCT